MQRIDPQEVARILDEFRNEEVYLHLEMTTGAYASHMDSSKLTAAAFIKNTKIRYSAGSIAGTDPYRVGLKTEEGWVFSQGLTHWTTDETGRLILAGHDNEGKLVVSLTLGKTPF